MTNSQDTKRAVPTSERREAAPFPIVGLGASAGGLTALKAFFANVPKDTGMAYVVVVHLTPKQPSMMSELLQGSARIPVSCVQDGEAVEPNHVYVIPSGKELSLYQGTLQLLDLPDTGHPLLVDGFLRSLAQDRGNRAAAVILSGTGTDGTLGVREIKGHDGLVLVQSEDSAEYDGMPRSAAGTGLADMVLPPGEMAPKLVDYFRNAPTISGHAVMPEGAGEPADWLRKVCAILRSRLGHDFSAYKANTIQRRIARRMAINNIESHEVYVRYLRENIEEANALFRELLIGVTSFFRDSVSFDALKEQGLPELLDHVPEDGTIRAWVPGCSTGEEVYTLLMILREAVDAAEKRINVQVFGTDIDSRAIDKARAGLFPANIAADVNEERLKRFFIREGDKFRVRKEIRDNAIFSVQDVLKDPPFLRLNLLCCRNVLIYFGADAQRKLFPLFHYTLVPGGILMLGSSESIGTFTDLFAPLDGKRKLFLCRDVQRNMQHQVQFPSGAPTTQGRHTPVETPPPPQGGDIGQLTQKAVLETLTAPAVLVNPEGEILHVLGHVGTYLETPAGPPSHNILDLARQGLRIELSAALRAARAATGKVTRRGIAIKIDGETRGVDLEVHPLREPSALAGQFLVVFRDVPATPSLTETGLDSRPVATSRDSVAELEKELQVHREDYQTTLEELESSNEELQSTNEELQSTNEELESSKEELQSLNEELQTVNSELQGKMEELSSTHDDMRNLLNSTQIATIFVDNDLRVRRFTKEATTIVNLIETDVGRPLAHVVSNLSYKEMLADTQRVIEDLVPFEAEVAAQDGTWYRMRIMPYRTLDNRIDGAVLTFFCIQEQKQVQESLRATAQEKEAVQLLAREVFDMETDPLVVLDADGTVIMANAASSQLFNAPCDAIEGRDIESLTEGLPELAAWVAQLRTTSDPRSVCSQESITLDLPNGKRSFSMDVHAISNLPDAPARMLVRMGGAQ